MCPWSWIKKKWWDRISGFIVMSPSRAVQSLKKSGQKSAVVHNWRRVRVHSFSTLAVLVQPNVHCMTGIKNPSWSVELQMAASKVELRICNATKLSCCKQGRRSHKVSRIISRGSFKHEQDKYISSWFATANLTFKGEKTPWKKGLLVINTVCTSK
jgi:hypothetical protein